MTEMADKTPDQMRAAKVIETTAGAAAGGALGAGVSLAAVLAYSALTAIVPVGGAVLGAVAGAVVAYSRRRKNQTKEDVTVAREGEPGV